MKDPAMEQSELLSLSHLKVFLHVAQAGSAASAARALFRAQSAVTRTLHELEQALGLALFERMSSGMLLTDSGRCVVERATRVFDELRTLAHLAAPKTNPNRINQTAGVASWMLNTRRLEIFVKLSHDRHMPTTARAFGISQPAVSSAIKMLEAGVGDALFYRSGRGLLLTAEGEAHLLYAQRALNELRCIPEDLAALQGNVCGVVTVGALPLGRAAVLPEAIARLSRKKPGIGVVTDESAYELLCSRLRAGEIDFILGAIRASTGEMGLVGNPLWLEDMVVVARKDHPLAGSKNLRMSELVDQRWILPRSHAPARQIFDNLFVSRELERPRAAVETADTAIIRGVLARTDMLAALSAHQLTHELDCGELVALPIRLASTERKIGLTLRAGSKASPAALCLLEEIRAVVAEMAFPSVE